MGIVSLAEYLAKIYNLKFVIILLLMTSYVKKILNRYIKVMVLSSNLNLDQVNYYFSDFFKPFNKKKIKKKSMRVYLY